MSVKICRWMTYKVLLLGCFSVAVMAKNHPLDEKERDNLVLTIAFGGRDVESMVEISHALVSGTSIAVGSSVSNPESFFYAALDVHSVRKVLSSSPSFQVGYGKYQNDDKNDGEINQGVMAGLRLEYPVNDYASIDAATRIVGAKWSFAHPSTVTTIGFKFKI